MTTKAACDTVKYGGLLIEEWAGQIQPQAARSGLERIGSAGCLYYIIFMFAKFA